MTNVIETELIVSSNDVNGIVRANTSSIRTLGAYVCAAISLSCALSSDLVVIPQRHFSTLNQYSVSTNPTPAMVYDNGSITVFSTNLDGVATMDGALEKNFRVLAEIAALESNWNGNGANAFSDTLLSKCREVLQGLRIQPDIFPTAQDSIQFEWEHLQGDYLEVELFEDGTCQMYMQRADGRWQADEIDSTEIGEKLDGFIAGNL